MSKNILETQFFSIIRCSYVHDECNKHKKLPLYICLASLSPIIILLECQVANGNLAQHYGIFWYITFSLFYVFLHVGVSIDLVCLAEQPLHTVPLLKYFNKILGQRDAHLGDDYNIPHWMNHNFYTSPKRRNKKDNYVPRIRVPDIVLSSLGRSSDGGKGEKHFLH